MGKQSSRLIYQGKDHKDIFFQGNLHDKMYVGSQLVWEKLYPDAYFLTIRTKTTRGTTQYNTVILSRDGAEEKVQCILDMSDFTYYSIDDFNKKFILCRFGQRTNNSPVQIGYFATSDTRMFKKIGEISVGKFISIEEGFYNQNNNNIVKISDDLSNVNVEECEKLPAIENISYPLQISYDCTFHGNFIFWGGYYLKLHASPGISYAVMYYSVLGSDGKRKFFQKEINIPEGEWGSELESKEATEWFIELGLISLSHSLVIGNHVYWIMNGSILSTGSYFAPHTVSGVFCKNMTTFESKNILDFYAENHFLKSGDLDLLYVSENKAILLNVLDYSQSIIIKIEDGSAKYLNIRNMSINVYGEDRTIDIVNEYGQGVSVNKITLIEKFSVNSKNIVTMNKRKYVPDSVNGMAFGFTYGDSKWKISGYMYIDNQDFVESENNYIYILEEYENGQLIFSR